MWIFTKKGYVSVVEDFDDRELLLVRARTLPHIVSFLGFDEGVYQDSHADYPFRCFVKRSDFEKIVVERTKEIDYPNFKNSVIEPIYHALLGKVWTILSVLGMGSRYRGGPASKEVFREPSPEDFGSPVLDDFYDEAFDETGAAK